MTYPDPTVSPRRGRDFLLGFFSTLLLGILLLILSAGINSPAIPALGLLLIGAGLVVAFAKGRRHIAFGILTAVVAVPLLLIGTCFAVFAMGGWGFS